MQLFEASRTYFEPLATIFVAQMSSHLQLFEASCTNLEPLANIFMHLPILSLLQLFEVFRTYRKPLEII